jgi:hypothetical protein
MSFEVDEDVARLLHHRAADLLVKDAGSLMKLCASPMAAYANGDLDVFATDKQLFHACNTLIEEFWSPELYDVT